MIEESTGAYRNLGLLYNDIERYHVASVAFKRCLYLDPDDGSTWGILARCYDEWGLDRESEIAFRRSIEADPERITVWRDYIELLLQNGRAEEALAMLENAPESIRRHAEIRVRQADMLRAAGRRGEALAVLRQLNEEGFHGAAFDYLSGELLLAAGEYVAAASALERFTRASPDEDQGWFLLARARAALKDVEGRKEALEEYKRARATKPEFAEEEEASTIEKALQALNQGNMIRAYPLFLEVLEENPLDPDAHYGVAIGALAGGTAEQVMPHIRRAEEICPLNAVGWANLANQYFARNDMANAMAAWRKSLLADPELQQPFDGAAGMTIVNIVNAATGELAGNELLRKAMTKFAEQDYAGAGPHLDALLREVRGERPRNLFLLAGLVWLQAGELEKALLYLDALARQDPPDKEAAFFAGIGLIRNARFQEGLETWKKAGLRWQNRITAQAESEEGEKS
jgi:tetratricopeptide (TPR) repeat protein